MAWSAPSTRSTGALITAAIWNQDVVDNPIALRAGGLAIASQAALDAIYASSATQFARLAKGSAYQHVRLNSAANAYEFADQYTKLLTAATGTTTNAAAENVVTLALSGLTALDTLVVYLAVKSVTQATANPQLYTTTGSNRLGYLVAGGGSAAAGTVRQGVFVLRQDPASSANCSAHTTVTIEGGTGFQQGENVGVTNWQGSHSIAVRHEGVTAGGTLHWAWAVYKLAGQ